MTPSIRINNLPKQRLHFVRKRDIIIHMDIHFAEPGEEDKTMKIPFLCFISLPEALLLDMPGNVYKSRASYSRGW